MAVQPFVGVAVELPLLGIGENAGVAVQLPPQQRATATPTTCNCHPNDRELRSLIPQRPPSGSSPARRAETPGCQFAPNPERCPWERTIRGARRRLRPPRESQRKGRAVSDGPKAQPLAQPFPTPRGAVSRRLSCRPNGPAVPWRRMVGPLGRNPHASPRYPGRCPGLAERLPRWGKV